MLSKIYLKTGYDGQVTHQFSFKTPPWQKATAAAQLNFAIHLHYVVLEQKIYIFITI